MLLCSSVAYCRWKTRKSKHSEAFWATRGLCVKERIVVLFDRYRKQAIKATTRGRRSKNVARIVGRVRRDVPLQVFPALEEKKADLARFLSVERVAQPVVDTAIVASCGCLN